MVAGRGAMKAPLPADEEVRLRVLRAYAVLDTPPERAYDEVTSLAAQICGAPVAAITLVDRERQWFKSRVGVDIDGTERDIAFCAHALGDPGETLVVPDATRDARFADMILPLLADPSASVQAAAMLALSRSGQKVNFTPLAAKIEDIAARYLARKQATNGMDFDDLLALWLKLMQENAEVRECYLGTLKYARRT